MKKIMIMMMLFAPMSIFAQKLAHVDTQAVIQSLPEIEKINGELGALAKEKENEIQAMAAEFQRRVEDYQKTAATMNQTKKEEVEKELGETQQKIQMAQQDAQQAIQKAQEEKFAPIQAKIRTAIENVAKAGGYAYVFEAAAFLYAGNEAKDITPDVKAELAKMK